MTALTRNEVIQCKSEGPGTCTPSYWNALCDLAILGIQAQSERDAAQSAKLDKALEKARQNNAAGITSRIASNGESQVQVAPAPAAPSSEPLAVSGETARFTEAEARKFVDEWLWQGAGRQTRGLEWGSQYIVDASRMCADFATLRLHEALPAVVGREENLAMMVRRLAARIRLRSKTGPHATPDNAMADTAHDLLKRYGLEGSPLRDEPRLTNGDELPARGSR